MGQKVESFPKNLYKGTKIEKHEFEFWKSNHTPLFFKDFVSTSENENIAKSFIKKNNNDFFPVLFRIDVEEAYKMKAIDIQAFSPFADKEFLISINSFLLVNDIKKILKPDGKLDYYLIVARFSDFKKIQLNEITKNYIANIENILVNNYREDIFYLAEYFKENCLYKEIGDLMQDLNPDYIG